MALQVLWSWSGKLGLEPGDRLKAESCRGPETLLEPFTGLAQGSEQ